jgi:tetratricopeptide (TPR) repeat protein
MLAETGMPVDEYLGLIDEQIVRIMDEGKPAEYQTSVTASWSVSVAKVRQQLPEATELLRCCAFFGPEPIPRDVFRRATQATDTKVSGLMQDSILFARAIRELGRFALVTIGRRSITVHRLVQALLRGELSPEEQASYRHDVHLILAAAAPPGPADDRQWPRYRELLPHVAFDATAFPDCRNPQVRQFALDIMRYLYLDGDHASCAELTNEFITQWTEDSGPDDPAVIDARRHHGNVLRALGRYDEARDLNVLNLEAARRVRGGSDEVTLAIQTSVAADERARGNFRRALDLDAEALALSQAVFGQTTPQTMRAISNLALDHGLNSDYRKAQEMSQVAYQLLSEANTGVSPTEVLITWHQMSWALRLQGDYSAARDVGEDALDYGRERLGADHPATIRTATALSIALRRIATGCQEGLQIAEETHEIARKRHGEVHPDTMAAAINWSNSLRTNGVIEPALALADETARAYPRVYGDDHPYYYGCLANLALIRRVVGEVDEARRIDELAFAGLSRRLGPDHDYTLSVAVNLASDMALLGDLEAAVKRGEDNRERLIRLSGKNDPLTLGCSVNLASDLRALGKVAEADELEQDTLRRYAATLGSGHPDAVVAGSRGRLDADFDPPPI